MRKVKRAKSAKRRRRKRVRPRARGADETALAMLAHEIRTPLNGILAMSELIASAELPQRERQWAGLVKGAAEHLANLTTLVVDGVRAEKHGLVLREDLFRPRALANEVGATLAARAEAKGLTADISIADDLPDEAIGDRVRLRAALENLVDNAVKFTEAGRVAFAVSANTTKRQTTITFAVMDSAAGLSPAETKRLFRPFSQASAASARRYGGAGLGLVFVRRLAKQMGGALKVESRVGKGSTFRLTVALKAAEASSSKTAGAETAKLNGARALRILCAEDNPYARAVMNTILVELGHRVDFAGTGDSAIAAVNRGGYDLVLMDVTLPGMDGLAATRAIRGLRGAAASVPIIGISGRTEAADKEAALAAGMNAFLAKPVSPSALANVLASI